MVTIFYKGAGNGPVCHHLARMAKEHFGETFNVLRDKTLPRDADFLVRWGSSREGTARRPVNTQGAVKLCNDKRASRKALRGICPTTWDKTNVALIQFPCIVRPRKHYGGQNLHIVNNAAEFAVLRKRYWTTGWYASEIIAKAEEYRVFVFQGRVLAVTQKFPQDASAVAWNIHQGGHTKMITRKNWNPKLLSTAIEATKRLGLDWGAVDLYVSNTGTIGVFEVNTSPGITTDRALKRIARAFVWADKNPAPPTFVGEIGSWKDILHPSLIGTTEEGENAAPIPRVEAVPVPEPVVLPTPPEPVLAPPPPLVDQWHTVTVRMQISAPSKALAHSRVRYILDEAFNDVEILEAND